MIGAPGQENDVVRAQELTAGFEADHVIADKGYDAGSFIEAVRQQGGKPVIPSRSCWKTPRDYDKTLYKSAIKSSASSIA
jgi:transposase